MYNNQRNVTHFSAQILKLTWFHRTMHVRPALIVHPIESRLNRQSRQHAIFATIAIGRRDVDRSTFVVQRMLTVGNLLVPALGDAQLNAGPFVHHRNGEHVELFFAALQFEGKIENY